MTDIKTWEKMTILGFEKKNIFWGKLVKCWNRRSIGNMYLLLSSYQHEDPM